MIRIVYGSRFLRSAKKLDNELKQKLAECIAILQRNPFNSHLHTKSLTGGLTGFFSFRITRDWRVIFKFLDPEIIQLIDVAHRKDIYR
ncbi:MAG: type II toxin-antitoxin system mRNA interferase toxin, RelE/StbE family [Parcubacteria group bacterium]|nr:type II toxin-antitoxin system mRNA interferase toxin, RelE/StbE family [Parcubacteria group bacterium]